jgi:MarR family 2-MHQ and catechol resistance regulon transcriptional repressor
MRVLRPETHKLDGMGKTRLSDAKGPEGTHVFLIIWKAYRNLLALADASKQKIHLCDSDFRVLEALLHKGALPVNVIGSVVDLTTGSITTAIDRLEEKWLVERTLHPQDRRMRIVELTSKGRRLIEKGYAQHQLDMEDAVKNLLPAERLQLIVLLKKMAGIKDADSTS